MCHSHLMGFILSRAENRRLAQIELPTAARETAGAGNGAADSSPTGPEQCSPAVSPGGAGRRSAGKGGGAGGRGVAGPPAVPEPFPVFADRFQSSLLSASAGVGRRLPGRPPAASSAVAASTAAAGPAQARCPPGWCPLCLRSGSNSLS